MYCFLWRAPLRTAPRRVAEKKETAYGDGPTRLRYIKQSIGRRASSKNQWAAALPFFSTQAAKASMNFCRKGLVLSDNAPDSSKKLPAPPR